MQAYGEWGILNLQTMEMELVSFKLRPLHFRENSLCYVMEINILACWVMILCSLVGGCQCLDGHLSECSFADHVPHKLNGLAQHSKITLHTEQPHFQIWEREVLWREP
jgi:hypothetical protein